MDGDEENQIKKSRGEKEDDPLKGGTIETDSTNDSDLLEPCGGKLGSFVKNVWLWIGSIFKIQNRRLNLILIRSAITIIIAIYVSFAIYTYVKSGVKEVDWCDGYGFGLILLIFTIFCVVYSFLIGPKLAPIIKKSLRRAGKNPKLKRAWRYCQLVVLGILIVALIVYAVLDTKEDRRRLISLLGWLILILIGFIFSKHPDYIRWPIVCKGLALQFIIGIITVKWEPGRSAFQCIGTKVEHFLQFAYSGATFVYGDELVNKQNVFAFQALSVLFFMGMIVQILFYYGWLQVACLKVGSIIQFILGSTIIESVNAITTIFLGMSEAPFVYNAYIKDLTKSEIHAIIAACFAAVAGSLLAAYAAVGANPSLIITASSMAAPGALGFAKLFYPEKRRSKTSSDTITLHESQDAGVLDAACKGATSSIVVVTGIIASLIATISFIAFLDGIISWLGSLLAIPGITFEYIVGKVFIPLAWIMGVTPSQVEDVGKLIGMKSVINEFVAYKELGVLKSAGRLTPRSEAIATFALCGFANPASLSIIITTLTSFAPNQRESVLSVAGRAFFSGSISSFLSACIVGFIMPENGFEDWSSASNKSI